MNKKYKETQRTGKLFGGGNTRVLGCVILIEFALIVILILIYIKTLRLYSVVFEDNSFSDYPSKIEFADNNSQYLFWEIKYMNMYSYPTDVVFAGDSLTYRCQWHELFPDLKVKNRGIGSDTTGGLLARLDSIVKTKPKKVFIMIGINDIGKEKSDKEIIENYEDILDELGKEGIEIYVQSILPVAEEMEWGGNEKIESVNAKIKQICIDRKVCYIDLYREFIDGNGYGKTEFYENDKVHLKPAGYEMWWNNIKAYIY